MVRILLISNNPFVNDGLSLNLKDANFDNFKVTGVDNGEQALSVLNQNFDFILLDLDIEDTKLLNFIKRVKIGYPSIPLIVFSHDLDYVAIKRCLIAGINGYCLLQGSNYQEIVQAIKKNREGKVYISAVMVELVASEALYSRKSDRLDSLNTQEFDIFLHLKKGETFEDIAKTFGVHISTIAFYNSRILDKLMISDVTEAEGILKMDSVF